MDLARRTSQILQGESFFRIDLRLSSGASFPRDALVPTYNGVIIVRTGVSDAVDWIVVWQVERC